MKLQLKNKLQYITLAAAAFAVFAVSGCNGTKENEQLKRSLNNLEVYIDSVDKRHHSQELDYTQAEWNRIDSGYEARRTVVEMELKENDDRKSNEKQEDLEERFNSLRSDYEQQRQARMDEAARGVEAAQKTLGITGTQITSEHITAQNYLQHYRDFIDTVDKYKKVYSTADWDKIDTYRDALKNRQKALNKTFSPEERINISELDTRYGSLKIHKLGAKIEEETNNNN